MSEHELVEIGRIGKAHGIKGELGVELNAEDPKLLTGHIFLRLPDGAAQPVQTADYGRERRNRAAVGRSRNAAIAPREYKVSGLRMHNGRPLLTLEGISDRNAAELLRNSVILVPYDRLPELASDEIFMRELPGLDIYLDESASDSEGSSSENALSEGDELPLLGRLDAVAEVAGQEIWTIITPEGKEVLLPANEEFVSEINLEEGYAVITPPPGLLDIYLG